MILLSPDQYYKADSLIKEVTFNNLFARAVIDRRVSGRVYADEANNPKTFYIVHSYGMSLLVGDHTSQVFTNVFKNYALNTNGNRNSHEWMQVYPAAWEAVFYVEKQASVRFFLFYLNNRQ